MEGAPPSSRRGILAHTQGQLCSWLERKGKKFTEESCKQQNGDFHLNVIYEVGADQMKNIQLTEIYSELSKIVLTCVCVLIIIQGASLLQTLICLHFITFFSGQGKSGPNNDEEPRLQELSFQATSWTCRQGGLLPDRSCSLQFPEEQH